MSEDLNNQSTEGVFNAFQYLSMKIMGNLVEIHSALPDGNIDVCRINLEEIQNITNMIEQAINAVDQLNVTEGDFDVDGDDDIEDYVDEDFGEPISEDELEDAKKLSQEKDLT